MVAYFNKSAQHSPATLILLRGGLGVWRVLIFCARLLATVAPPAPPTRACGRAPLAQRSPVPFSSPLARLDASVSVRHPRPRAVYEGVGGACSH